MTSAEQIAYEVRTAGALFDTDVRKMAAEQRAYESVSKCLCSGAGAWPSNDCSLHGRQ